MSLPEVDGRPVRVETWGRTDPGRVRTENQDTFLILHFPGGPGEPTRALRPGDRKGDGSGDEWEAAEGGGEGRELHGNSEFTVGPRGALLIVADGMGGAAGGATASREAVSRVHRAFVERWDEERQRTPQQFARHLRRAAEEANAHLHQMARSEPSLDGMGTTLTAAGLLDDFVYMGQVGDSRGYLVRDGSIVQLTRDQSMVQELVDSGAMTQEQARRSSQRNVILQALGIQADVEVDVTFQQLREGDLLLLCSDGLSGVLEDHELAEYAERFRPLPALCEALVELANSRGGPDNITVVAARVSGPGLQPPRSGEQAGHEPFPFDDS